jgi:hypothetical protein
MRQAALLNEKQTQKLMLIKFFEELLQSVSIFVIYYNSFHQKTIQFHNYHSICFVK